MISSKDITDTVFDIIFENDYSENESQEELQENIENRLYEKLNDEDSYDAYWQFLQFKSIKDNESLNIWLNKLSDEKEKDFLKYLNPYKSALEDYYIRLMRKKL